MRNYILLVITIKIIMSTTGCSMISIDTYYSPSIEKLKSEKHRWFPCGGPDIINTGPNHIAILYEENDLTIKVRVMNRENLPILFGPLYFPVVPVFFFGKDSLYNDEGKIVVDINASENIPFVWEPKKCKLINSEGTVFYPDEVSSNSNNYVLQFYIGKRKVTSFDLQFGEMTINKDKSISPSLNFEESKGYIFCIGP